MKQKSIWHVVMLLIVLFLFGGCVRLTPYEEYVMRAVNMADNDTICLQFVGYNYAKNFSQINQKFIYHNDTSTIIISKVGTSYATVGFPLIDKNDGENWKHFNNVLPVDTVNLLCNGHVLQSWNRNVDTTDLANSIFDRTNWTYCKEKTTNYLVYKHTYTIDMNRINSIMFTQQ